MSEPLEPIVVHTIEELRAALEAKEDRPIVLAAVFLRPEETPEEEGGGAT